MKYISPELIEAANDMVGIIEKAGLLNLSNGVQLGPTVWYVRACENLRLLKDALAKIKEMP